jgi:thiol-disulfide isomerase/thioredoxin
MPLPSALRRTASLLAVALFCLTACSNVGSTGDLEYIEQEGGVIQVAVGDREDPVDLSGTTLAGEDLDLADLRGDVVVVNVWWSGCAPCRREAPILVEASEALDAEFVGINIRDNSEAAAAAFERASGVGYPSLYDPGSETLLAFGPRFIPRSPPTTLVLDRKGRVAAVISGEIPSANTLSEVVEEVSAEDG